MLSLQLFYTYSLSFSSVEMVGWTRSGLTRSPKASAGPGFEENTILPNANSLLSHFGGTKNQAVEGSAQVASWRL